MPVARKVWQQTLLDRPAAIALRLIMRMASGGGKAVTILKNSANWPFDGV